MPSGLIVMSPLGTPAVATILGDLGVSFPVAGLRVYCETAPAVLDRLSTASALVPCGLTAMSYGNSPLATFGGVSGRSAPDPSVASWEISFVPPLPVTYTNGAPAGEPVGAGASAAVHPAASPQAITARTAARPIRRPRLSQPRPRAAPNIAARLTAPRTPPPRTAPGRNPADTRGYDWHPDRSPIHPCILPTSRPGTA